MPDVATVLKAEISRIARKEVKSETAAFKKASSHYRSQIAALRKKIDSLEKQIRRAGKTSSKSAPEEGSDDSGKQRRFSATRLAATRQKLGLSAEQMGTLIGVSGQSIYKWEKGEVRPRPSQLEAIAKVRGIGKREAAARLEALAEMS